MTIHTSENPIKILIVGPNGKMGKAMIQIAFSHPEVALVGGVGPKGCAYLGKDLGQIAGLGENTGAIVYDSIEDSIGICDVVLECTNALVAMKCLEWCVTQNKALVSGTTGFNEEEIAAFQEAGETIPVVLASNTSKIAHIYFDVINYITAKIGRKADIDIIEIHDRNKLDAPSGTSKEIGRGIAAILERNFDDIARYERKGSGRRVKNTLDYSSIRSGNHNAKHTVIFGFDNEQLELSIRGDNMLPYAEGMIQAALFIYRQSAGFYTIKQVFAADNS
ncbi:MAG: 4-hydroxy-tetrahydrodipicolinate reductase [Desulfobulbaceae bacterium]|nr:4-hydroxy-tetrahydrodipicolinate reductase [Desulfobulbaceae bacterium]